MHRRDFLALSAAGLAAGLFLPGSDSGGPDAPAFPVESSLWLHGSPYLGHSDFRRDFRGLTPDEARLEMAHFRTAEPWRRTILFRL